MPNTFDINTGSNQTEFTIHFLANNGAVIPVINGESCRQLMFGYTSEADKQAGMKLIRDAVAATNGDVRMATAYIYNAISAAANGVTPDVQIEVDGYSYMVSFADRKAYTLNGEEVANLDDITGDMCNDAIVALLTERIRANTAYDDAEMYDPY